VCFSVHQSFTVRLLAQVVIATNIAETSVTINGIVYGRCTPLPPLSSPLLFTLTLPLSLPPSLPLLCFPLHYSTSLPLSPAFSLSPLPPSLPPPSLCVVIDCGFVKLKAFSPKTALGKLHVSRVSQLALFHHQCFT